MRRWLGSLALVGVLVGTADAQNWSNGVSGGVSLSSPTLTGTVTLPDTGTLTATANSFIQPLSITDPSTSDINTLRVSSTANANGVNLVMVGTGAAPSKTLRVLNSNFGILNNAYTAVILALTDTGNFSVPGTGTFSGTGTTGVSTAACFSTTFQLVSDAANCITSLRALKRDIRPLSLDDSLADLEALTPRSFWWKDGKEPGQRFGFVAEEVEAADRRLATYDGEHQLRAYDANALIAELWLVVRHQQQQISALSARLDARATRLK